MTSYVAKSESYINSGKLGVLPLQTKLQVSSMTNLFQNEL